MSIYIQAGQLQALTDEQLADLAKILKDEQQRRKDCEYQEMKAFFARKVQELQEFAVKAREKGYEVELEIEAEGEGTTSIYLDRGMVLTPYIYRIYQSKG